MKGPGPEQSAIESKDLDFLLSLGKRLDSTFKRTLGLTLRDFLVTVLLKIRDKKGRLVCLKPNESQRQYSQTCGRRNIVLKARQLGITTWIAARFFISTITRPGRLSVQVAHDHSAAQGIFRIVHRFWENLPERLRNGALHTSRANVGQITFPLLDSEYRVESAADADAGRGLTIHHLHASEVARWPGDAAATLASLRAALTPDGEMVQESTPRGASGCFFQEWQQADETGTVQHFSPWWNEDLYRSFRPLDPVELSEDEQQLVSRYGLDLLQIAYRREIKQNFRGLAKQEFAEDPESCFLSSEDCFFDIIAVEHRLQELGVVDVAVDGVVGIMPPLTAREYIVGVDPAGGGVDGDYACAQVIDRASGMQCAELHGHYPPGEMARRVAMLGRRFNLAMLIVEKNGIGHSVLSSLQNAEKYDNLYSIKGEPGFTTTTASRPELLDNLAAVFMAEPGLLRSPRLLREMRTFVRQRNGSGAADHGSHDDCVMAMALALMARQETAGMKRDREVTVASLGGNSGF